MVIVSASTKRAIEWINGQAFYDPYNWPLIATELGSCGYSSASEWIAENPSLYLQGVREGFTTPESDNIYFD